MYLLSSHINSNPNDNIINLIIGSNNSATSTPSLGEEEELKTLSGEGDTDGVGSLNSNNQNSQGTNRYSYRAAIYSDTSDIG